MLIRNCSLARISNPNLIKKPNKYHTSKVYGQTDILTEKVASLLTIAEHGLSILILLLDLHLLIIKNVIFTYLFNGLIKDYKKFLSIFIIWNKIKPFKHTYLIK